MVLAVFALDPELEELLSKGAAKTRDTQRGLNRPRASDAERLQLCRELDRAQASQAKLSLRIARVAKLAEAKGAEALEEACHTDANVAGAPAISRAPLLRRAPRAMC